MVNTIFVQNILLDCFRVTACHTKDVAAKAVVDSNYSFISFRKVLPGLVSSVRRALSCKLRGPEFKFQPGTVGGPVTIIMWGAQPEN